MLNYKSNLAIKRSIPFVVLCLVGLFFSGWSLAEESSDLKVDEFKPRLLLDFGHIVNGQYYTDTLKFSPINRNSVVLEQGGTIGEKFSFNFGLMGTIWWPFSVTGLEPHERTIRVAPLMHEAAGKFMFSPEENNSHVMFGLFPYKYNPDARNLGEYLYRAGTYPGTITTTDGLRLIDYPAFNAYGVNLHLEHAGGLFSHNLNVFSEPTSVPVGDLTPSYDAALKFSVVELGGGISFYRLFSFAPSRLRDKELANAYIEVAGDSTEADSSDWFEYYKGPFKGLEGRVSRMIERGDSVQYSVLHYWTQAGVKVMGRLALDFGTFLPEHLRTPGDLRLFFEVALLGWKDQPFFYEDRSRRMPLMMGFNLPTFKKLDMFQIQVERYTAAFNNSKSYVETAQPVWVVPNFDNYSPDQYKRDDWKWSVFVHKQFSKLMGLKLQVANDHLRLPLFNTASSDASLTLNPTHWYYVARLEMGLK